jgi:hypothetical protein
MSEPAERLIETVDGYEEACARRRYWASQIVRLGLQDEHGIYIKMIRLSPAVATFGIYVGEQPPVSFTCPACEMTSHNPEDVAQGYCGNCHAWTGTSSPAAP